MQLHYKNLPLSHYVQLLKDKIPFSFARYGDGEWLTILGYIGGHNSNGCTFTRELSDDLNRVLSRENDYYHAILGIARKKKEDEIVEYLSYRKVNLTWFNGDVILNANLNGRLFPLIEQIRERNVLYVGNEKLRGLNMRGVGFFPYTVYVEVPPLNTHASKDEILAQVYRLIEKHNIDFVGWSAGLASKVFIDETFMKYPDVTQIDFGSCFDAFFKPLDHILNRKRNNTGSRSYIRKGGYDWAELLRKNTKGE